MQRFVAPHCTILIDWRRPNLRAVYWNGKQGGCRGSAAKEQAAQAEIKRQQAEEAAKRAAAEAAKKKEEAAEAAPEAAKNALQEALEAESKKRMLDEQFDKSNQLMKELMARRANLEAQEKEFKLGADESTITRTTLLHKGGHLNWKTCALNWYIS